MNVKKKIKIYRIQLLSDKIKPVIIKQFDLSKFYIYLLITFRTVIPLIVIS